ncbi:hypothetical protein [Lunatimonas salinarum]|uniref:hypothetical protein n=1 Tax=Lunatimonas salinarum TaxID=1774590 RepID=UPI001ADFF4B4|nr:hypothetical protein [Lunatimonas salinarum]
MNYPVLFYLLVFLLFGTCRNEEEGEESEDDGAQTQQEKPLREPYAGMNWEKISGAGMEFWAQQSPDLRVGISETLPGAFVERMEYGKPVALQRVLQVFYLPNKKIEDLLDILAEYEGWSKSAGCSFEAIDSNREGVGRYELRPTGKARREYEERAAVEPITHTCAGWGMGNSGIRYFEIHRTNPDKALFVEIGQEAPLFDENSIYWK